MGVEANHVNSVKILAPHRLLKARLTVAVAAQPALAFNQSTLSAIEMRDFTTAREEYSRDASTNVSGAAADADFHGVMELSVPSNSTFSLLILLQNVVNKFAGLAFLASRRARLHVPCCGDVFVSRAGRFLTVLYKARRTFPTARADFFPFQGKQFDH